jgi:transposase InsO family protein
MSALKYQLKDLLPSLSDEANKISDREVKQRFYLIRAVCESKKDVKKSCEMKGFSTDFFNKWGNRLLEAKSLEGLKTRSKAPKSFWNLTQKRVVKRVIKYKKRYPYRGPETISFYLKKLFNIVCHPSTIYDILKRHNLISRKYRKERTKAHIKRYRRPWPGYLQMDIKYVPYKIQGQQYYQFSAIDHHSSWRIIRIYSNRTLKTVLGFLDNLYEAVPFEIIQIQTDNATEFTDKFSSQGGLRPTEWHGFDQWCLRRGIEHKLIPVGEKEINGKVENSHKWDDEEFYSQQQYNSLTDLDMASKDYNLYWNQERYTRRLGWRTPDQVVELAYLRAFVFLKISEEKYRPPKVSQKPINYKKVLTDSGYILMPENQTQKPDWLDRYLGWMAWEEKNKKYLLPMPLIIPIYSLHLQRTWNF